MAGSHDGGGVQIVLERSTARALLRALSAALSPPGPDGRGEELTPRETEVMAGLSEGKGYGQIAAELVIELETVRTHARRVRRKLGVATSSELRGRRPPGAENDPQEGSEAARITP